MPKGNLTQRYRRIHVTGCMMEFPCKNAEDVGKHLSIPFQPSNPNVEGFLACHAEIGEEGLVLAGIGDAICLPATILSPEGMCLLWIEAPELMQRLIGLMPNESTYLWKQRARKALTLTASSGANIRLNNSDRENSMCWSALKIWN